MPGPLDGLRVLDCSLGTAGPQATGLLADYGADVIWVEPPGGDPARRSDPAAVSVFNRGKRSVILDVENAADRETLLSLARWADVFVEGWSPGRADELGLGYARLHALNAQLIYCSISGFGPFGPHKGLPAYEPLVHALIGTMAQQAGHREPPIFQGLPFASTGAAQLAVIGILASLNRRFDDGVGRQVETSLFDGALAFHSMLWGETDASLKAQAGAPSNPPTMRGRTVNRLVARSFLCADGEYIGVHTAAVGGFGRLMQVLGLDKQIPSSPDGIDVGSPLSQQESDLLEREIHGIFAAQPRAYWVKRLMEADVCGIEHLRPTAVFDEAQTRHNAMVVSVDDPVLGPVEQVAPGVRFDGASPVPPPPAPTPGRDTDAVLAELSRTGTPSKWRSPADAAARPDTRPLLDGVKILDLGAYYAGPYSSRLLADLGADVIKVEPVVGDQLRGIERPFFSAQAGKRSLAANLKDAGLAKAAKALIEWADIICHNMRPGAAERLGLGLEQVKAANANVIYLYAPGWGSTGPHMKRQSFAPMLSGYVGASHEVAGQFNEPLPSIGNEDPGNGLLGAIAMLISLLARRTAGKAYACENPQLNASLCMMAHVVRNSRGEAVGAGRLDVLQTGVESLESLYETADGWMCLVARTDVEIQALERVLGMDILADPRFASLEARRTNRDVLVDRLRSAFGERPTDTWLKAFEGSGVPLVAPAGASATHDLFNDPLQQSCGRVGLASHPDKGLVKEVAHLVRVTDADVAPHRLAPGLGQHSDEVLRWAGYSPDEISGLRTRGVVR